MSTVESHEPPSAALRACCAMVRCSLRSRSMSEAPAGSSDGVLIFLPLDICA